MTNDSTMRALRVAQTGGPEVLRLDRVHVPEPGAGEVRLRIRACGVSGGDLLFRRGVMPAPTPLPWVPGFDVAGDVDALGPGVTGLAVGDRVLALLAAGGGAAELAIAPAATTFRLPDEVGYATAGALVSGGATAACLLTRAGPLEGRSVLVTAAAGGVGSLLVQLVRLGGGTVVAAAGAPDRVQAARELGAHHAVSYLEPEWATTVREHTGDRGVDVVLEAVGGEVFERSLDLLAPSGTIVLYGAASDRWPSLDQARIRQLAMGNQRVVGFVLQTLLREQPSLMATVMDHLLALAASGQLQAPHRIFALGEGARAHAELEGRGVTGKAILDPTLRAT